MVWRGQGIPMLRTLRAYGAHKGPIFAVFAGFACKNRPKMTCEAGQNAGHHTGNGRRNCIHTLYSCGCEGFIIVGADGLIGLGW